MRNSWFAGGLFLSVLSSAGFAKPSVDELAAASAAEVRGDAMFAYDQAAWHATDKFQEDLRRQGVDLAKLAAQGFKGYIVEPGEGGQLLASFYAQRDGRSFALARYRVTGSTVSGGGLVEPDSTATLSLLALRMIDAREKAIQQMALPDHALCSNSPANTLVLPPQADGSVPVYVLTSTAVGGVYPAGGHYRFDYDADGKLSGERRFMKSCFPIDYRSKDGNTLKAVFLTHLLDPQPTEIHVFVQRNIPISLMVGTVSNNAMWSVEAGKVRYVRDFPK